jgi:hypothetical protein
MYCYLVIGKAGEALHNARSLPLIFWRKKIEKALWLLTRLVAVTSSNASDEDCENIMYKSAAGSFAYPGTRDLDPCLSLRGKQIPQMKESERKEGVKEWEKAYMARRRVRGSL